MLLVHGNHLPGGSSINRQHSRSRAGSEALPASPLTPSQEKVGQKQVSGANEEVSCGGLSASPPSTVMQDQVEEPRALSGHGCHYLTQLPSEQRPWLETVQIPFTTGSLASGRGWKRRKAVHLWLVLARAT